MSEQDKATAPAEHKTPPEHAPAQQQDQATGTRGASGRFAAIPPMPRNKACRVIRVKTREGVIALINADDYDPEFKGHEALTPEDARSGMIAVEARQRTEYEAEKLAAIKRVVRGG